MKLHILCLVIVFIGCVAAQATEKPAETPDKGNFFTGAFDSFMTFFNKLVKPFEIFGRDIAKSFDDGIGSFKDGFLKNKANSATTTAPIPTTVAGG